MIELIGPFNSGDAVGSSGSALSNQDSTAHVAGLLEAVFVRYNPDYPDNPPGTTKVTITTKGANGSPPTRTILILDNANTDGWFQPRSAIHNGSGAAISDLYDKIPLYDFVNVAIEETNADNNVDVWFLVST
jgi:hypothetical protein